MDHPPEGSRKKLIRLHYLNFLMERWYLPLYFISVGGIGHSNRAIPIDLKRSEHYMLNFETFGAFHLDVCFVFYSLNNDKRAQGKGAFRITRARG